VPTSTTPRPPVRAQPRVPESERPGCLTAVCLFLLVTSLAWLLLAAIDPGKHGRWYPAHFVLQALAVAAAGWGLWRMEKWGAILLGIVAVLVHVLYFATGLANFETFVVYATVVGPAIYFYRRMR
jgi:hypothetical protein